MVRKRILLFTIIAFFPLLMKGQAHKEQWVNATYGKMELDEKLGQLFMMRAFSGKDKNHINTVKNQIKKYKVGGLCFFQGTPEKQASLINEYQDLSDIPLLIGIDGEWGVNMRFPGKSTPFPRQLMLGAIQDDRLIYEMGKEIAYQCDILGIHVNFAPVADVNNNPNNPVINERSFGEDMHNVAAKTHAYMKGMQDHGVMACAKHFPGHGDTDTDSHYDLPVLNHSYERLDSIELMPFKVLADQGVGSMMTAHLSVPAIDNRPNLPTSISYEAITGILRNKIGFDGLVFTDAMEMQGVLKHHKPGYAEAEALRAGNDIILLTTDIEKSFDAIKSYLEDGKIPMDQFEKSVKRVLGAKYDLHIHQTARRLQPSTAENSLNRAESLLLQRKLVRNAITLVSDIGNKLPFSDLSNRRIVSLAVGAENLPTSFQSRLSDYSQVKNLRLSSESTPKKRQRIIEALKEYNEVIISIHEMSTHPKKNFGITEATRTFLQEVESAGIQPTLVVFGNPYSLDFLGRYNQLIVSYDDKAITQDLTAQAIFGAGPFLGRLPVTAGTYAVGTGIDRKTNGRMGYNIPESHGMNSDTLALIDDVIEEMISTRAAPGCQIIIAKGGDIIFDKQYGFHTYKKYRKVEKESIYDVASVTKVMASTLSLMSLEERNLIDLKEKVARYIPQLDTTNKKDMVMEDMLAHHARLIGWIPFYKSTMSESKVNPKPKPTFYAKQASSTFNIPIAKHLYLRSDYRDSIWNKIYSSKLRTRYGYRYSDLAFYLAHKVVENTSGMGVDLFAQREFYSPMGLYLTGFNPYAIQKKNHIVPSEEDSYFRRQKVQGYVHDMGAAMLGGVSGHAGLFSTSREMAYLGQMLLNKGYYGGVQYLQPSTVQKFTSRYHKSTRRGIGFDMKELNSNRSQNMSELASPETFGHLGFTGTAVFIDPKHDLVYVFLSNRTYPRMENRKFIRKEYRPRVQSIMYRALSPMPLP